MMCVGVATAVAAASAATAVISRASAATTCGGNAFYLTGRFHLSSPLIHTKPPSLILCTSNKSLNASRSGFSVSASRRRGGKKGTPLDVPSEMEEAEDYDEEEGWEDVDDEEEEGEEEEEGLMPFEKMRRWLRSKPAGFGVGKTYDVSLEEELMEEMERSREVNLANINKLKNGQANAAGTKKKQQQQMKVAEVTTTGVHVRIGNLPRKRNIHKDLQLAFKDFPGIININPAVIGNKKTRDPVCKGFAFLDLKSEEVANRFVQAYSKQSILFGKVQKKITCQVMNPGSLHNSDSDMLAPDNQKGTKEWLGDVKEEMHMELYKDNMSFNSQENSDGSSRNEIEEQEVRMESSNQQSSSQMITETSSVNSEITILNVGERSSERNGDGLASRVSPSVETQKKQSPVSKKKKERTKSLKAPKLNVPGSANRLKIQERNVLTGVFSKYGGKAAPALTK